MDKKSLYIIINSIIFIKLIPLINFSTCTDKENPFLKDNQCVSFCSKEELKLKTCIIDEETVKIQFMTNLIIVGSKDYRYININSNQYNDMVIQTSKSSGSGIGSGDRLFYGLKNNGRFLFKNESLKESPYLYYKITGEATQYQQRYEGESSFIQLYDENNPSNNGKEYYLSIGKGEQYAELFDFENNDYNTRKSSSFFKKVISSDRGTFIRLKHSNTNYDYFYLIIAVNKEDDDDDDEEYAFYLKAFSFSSYILSTINEKKSGSIECSKNKIVSCFETLNGKIICFYRLNRKYVISIFECCFSKKKSFEIDSTISVNTFYKEKKK